MWKYRVSFRNMINVTFVTGRRGSERRVGGRDKETVYGDSRFMFVSMFIYHYIHNAHSKNKLTDASGRFLLLINAPHTDVHALLWWPQDFPCGANMLESDFHKLSDAERGERFNHLQMESGSFTSHLCFFSLRPN